MKFKSMLVIAAALLAVSLTSCNNNSPEIDGLCEDSIRLSTGYANFGANQESVTITTEQEWWWFSDITIGNDIYQAEYQTNMFDKEYVSVDADWLTVERLDAKTIKLTVEPNSTGEDRSAYVHLQAGNCFNHIAVTQTKD